MLLESIKEARKNYRVNNSDRQIMCDYILLTIKFLTSFHNDKHIIFMSCEEEGDNMNDFFNKNCKYIELIFPDVMNLIKKLDSIGLLFTVTLNTL